LYYSYDPTGNIIIIRDDAQQTIYFDGEVVRPDAEYWYDAVYRLIEAHGREHIGQTSQPHTTWDDKFRVVLEHPNNGKAMRNYFEFYEYDYAGNILSVDHKADGGNWVRTYEYNDRKSNRLSQTVVHPNSQQPIQETYAYDDHGNMTKMPHLPEMVWDFEDQLQMVNKGGSCNVYYVYDASGQRVRKVVEQENNRLRERIYFGGFEVYREYNGNVTPKLERETLHAMDDKQRIALVETRTQGTDLAPKQLIRYQLGNHLGSANLELDNQAKIIFYEEYYPFGSTSYQGVRKQTEIPKRYRNSGKERDEESGLYYHGARYYSPWLCQWINPDPRTDIVSAFSRYQYCSSNPISFKDENGERDDWALNLNALSFAVPSPNWRPPKAPQTSRHGASDAEFAFVSSNKMPDFDKSLYVQPGFFTDLREKAIRSVENTDNPWWKRAGAFVGQTLLAYPSWGEEYVGRPIANVPYSASLAGQYAARATLRQRGDILGKVEDWSMATGLFAEATSTAMSLFTPFSSGSAKTKNINVNINQPNVMRALRQSQTIEGSATAKLIKRGKVSLGIRESPPSGICVHPKAAAYYVYGSNELTLLRPKIANSGQAAGYTAHEARHYIQDRAGVSPSKLSEIEAYEWQSRVDTKAIFINDSQKRRNFVDSNYKNLPEGIR
jgi:RHS repeat-associated protein